MIPSVIEYVVIFVGIVASLTKLHSLSRVNWNKQAYSKA